MFKKIITITLSTLIIIVALLFAIPFLFKGQIVNFAKKQLNKQLTAIVDFDDINLSLLRSFPNLHLSINDLSVVGRKEFKGDTLLLLDKGQVVVNVQTLFNQDDISIKSIKLVRPNVNALVLKNGKANWDIVASSDTPSNSENSEYNIALQKYQVVEGNIFYHDETTNTKAQLTNLNHTGKGDFTQDIFVLSTLTTIDALSATYEGIEYLRKVNTKLEADIEMDNINNKYTLKNNNLHLNYLDIGFDGYIKIPNEKDIETKMAFNAKQTDFKNILSLMPAAFKNNNEFKKVKASGKMALNGNINGIYNDKRLPNFNINLNVDNGEFQYPDLPQKMSNINLKTAIANSTGQTDDTNINIPVFNFTLDGEKFESSALFKNPISNPLFKVEAKGKIKLGELFKTYPLEDVQELTGMLTADLKAEGTMDDIEKERYNNVKTAGYIDITDMVYRSSTLPDALMVRNMGLIFTSEFVNLNRFDAKIGPTDLKANGRLENFLAYSFANGKLNGQLDVDATYLDCDQWLTETENTTSEDDAAAFEVFRVPENIDFTINAKAKKVKYDKIKLSNVAGTIYVKDEQMRFQNVQTETLGGKINIDGTYNTKNRERPLVDFAYNIQRVNILEAVTTFYSLGKIAPIAENLAGNFSSQFELKGELNEEMFPDLMTFSGEGMAAVIEATLTNSEIFQEIGKKLQINELKRINVVDVQTFFTIEDGFVVVKPFKIKPFDIAMNISGAHGFDQSLNYQIATKVPRNLLGSQANSLLNNLLNQASSKGFDLDVPDNVNINLNITGTINKPKIKVNYDNLLSDTSNTIMDYGKEILDSLKNTANAIKDEAVQKVEEGKAYVNEEIDKAKDEANQAIQQGIDSSTKFVQEKVETAKEEATEAVEEKADALIEDGKEQISGASDSLKNDIKNTASDKAKDAVKGLWGKKKKDE